MSIGERPKPVEGLSLPIHDIYHIAESDWSTLCQFFRVSGDEGVPAVVTFGTHFRDKTPTNPLETLAIAPLDIPSEKRLEIEDLIAGHDSASYHPGAIKLKDTSGWYEQSIHALFFNRTNLSRIEEFASVMSEEVTHSLVSVPEPFVTFSLSRFDSLENLPKSFHRQVAQAAHDAEGPNYSRVDLNEFFPPLALAFQNRLRGDLLRRHKNLGVHIPQSYEEKVSQIFNIHKLIRYLPEYAADLLLRQYGNNAEAILQEYPDLPSWSGEEIWAKICLPILTTGKLSN